MKNYLYISIISVCGFLSVSCSDFLDVKPEGTPTTVDYFLNDNQAIDAIKGLYAPIHQEDGYGRELFWEQGAACDIVWARTRGYNSLATFEYTGDESPLRNVFSLFYDNMQRSNWIIQKLLQKEATTTLSDIEKRSLGEAYFMRGMSHFIIAYRYGTDKQGVPFIQYETLDGEYDNSIPPQSKSVMEDYRLIIEDMDKALSYLPRFESYTAEDRGRTHQAAAVAYKAKVYAYWATWEPSKWENVIQQVNLLETEYSRALAPSLNTLFSSDFADFWNSEYIWSIPSNGGNKGGGVAFPGVILEDKGWGKYNGWGQIKPSYDIFEEMLKDGENNQRIVRSILQYGQQFQFLGEQRIFYSATNLDVGFQINKYMDPFKYKDASSKGYINTNGNFPTVRINFPIIRFAEMLLFRAEAYLMTGHPEKATVDLNLIRSRSKLLPLTAPATMIDLYHERRCELAFEYSDHLFDLKRWHRSSNSEIKALAAKELNAHPRIRKYADRSNPDSPFTIAPYADYLNKSTYQDYMMVFPYPSEQIIQSNGQLKQNEGY